MNTSDEERAQLSSELKKLGIHSLFADETFRELGTFDIVGELNKEQLLRWANLKLRLASLRWRAQYQIYLLEVNLKEKYCMFAYDTLYHGRGPGTLVGLQFLEDRYTKNAEERRHLYLHTEAMQFAERVDKVAQSIFEKDRTARVTTPSGGRVEFSWRREQDIPGITNFMVKKIEDRFNQRLNAPLRLTVHADSPAAISVRGAVETAILRLADRGLNVEFETRKIGSFREFAVGQVSAGKVSMNPQDVPKKPPKEIAPYINKFVDYFLSLQPNMSYVEFKKFVETGIYGPHEEERFVEDVRGLHGVEEAGKLRKLWRMWHEVAWQLDAPPYSRFGQVLEEFTGSAGTWQLDSPLQELAAEKVAAIESEVREELLRSPNKLLANMEVHDPHRVFAFVGETFTPVKGYISKPMSEFAKEIRGTRDFSAWKAEMERLNKIARQEGKIAVWHRPIDLGSKWTTTFHYRYDCYVILEMRDVEPQKYEITNEILLREDLPPDYVKAFPKDPLEYYRQSWPTRSHESLGQT